MVRRRPNLVCRACGVACPPRYGIPDPCLGTLPRVLNACCGHGFRRQCYVVIEKMDGTGTYDLRGDRARAWMITSGGNPAEFTAHSIPEGERGSLPGWKES